MLSVTLPQPLDASPIQMMARLVVSPIRPLERCEPPIDVDIYDPEYSPIDRNAIKDPNPRATWDDRLAHEIDGPLLREFMKSIERGYFVIGAISTLHKGKQRVTTLEYAEVVRRGNSYELLLDESSRRSRGSKRAATSFFMDGARNVMFMVSVAYHTARAMHSPETVYSHLHDIKPPKSLFRSITGPIFKFLGWAK